MGIGGIAAPQPNHSWRRSKPFEQAREVGIFGENTCIGTSCRFEDRAICGIA